MGWGMFAVHLRAPGHSRFSDGWSDADVVGVMAAKQVSAGRERGSPESQHLSGSLGPRALRIGLRTTLLAPLGAAASVAIFGEEGPGLGSFLPLFLGLVALGALVAFLPWERLLGTPTGSRILLVWAVLDVLLITVAGRATGATHAALPLAYAVTFIFFAVVLSPGAQVMYLCLMLACYGVVSSSNFEPLSFLMLATVGVLTIFLARELRWRIAAHERARKGSERRWAVVGSVSRAARDVSGTEVRRVLEGVVEAIVALGYETAAIHLPGEQGELQVVLPGAVAADPTLGIRTLPDSILTQVLGEGRDAIVRVKDVDRQAARGLRSSDIGMLAGTPIVLGERPAGVLLVGSTDPDGISAKEVEAFAMLATTAAMALNNARRAEERREVDEHVADANAVRAEVLATLSTEVRKPLGAVTETSRALRETFGNEERRLLIERLVRSATALDVTLGGSLDLSLLESSRIELHYEEVDVGELVSGVLTRLADLLDGRELRADVPTGLIVEADRALLGQAVEHLLATAAASTPPGKAVEVAVSRTGAETTVKVATDTVIPSEQLARIRERRAAGNGGAGSWIRLALASKILELHGSELQTRSDPQQGTRAWFVVPGERSAQPPLARGVRGVAADTGPMQLSLDDALLPAVAAAAAGIEPPPVEIEEEQRSSTPLAAAALAATAATTLAVTGIVPQLLHQPNVPAASSEQKERRPKKADEKERPDASRKKENTGTVGSSGNTTDVTQTGGTTGGTGGSTGGGTGGGTGGSGETVTPAPSPTPPPPGHDGDPGKSGEAPGHNKTPSPSPSP
jgi:signal transduction histidine kinase